MSIQHKKNRVNKKTNGRALSFVKSGFFLYFSLFHGIISAAFLYGKAGQLENKRKE
jgi:hypothetical protein